jgi:hypothetical protein
VVVLVGVATVARDACTPDRRRPNRQAGPAAGPAAATGSGRRRRFWASQPLQGEEAVRDRDQRDVVVPARPAAAFEMVQPKGTLELAVVLLDGLITNGKFCCTRRVRLGLSWWHRPLRLRRSGLQTDAVLVGEPDEPDLDRLPPVQPPPRRRPSLGSGLPVAGALGSRARRRHPAGGAEGTGGA